MRLFKYVHPDRIDILRDQRIRFTPAMALNDPFELRPYFDAFASDAALLQRAQEKPVDITPHIREGYEQLDDATKARLSFEELATLIKMLLDSPYGAALMVDAWDQALGVFKGLVPTIRSSMWDVLTSKIGILSLTTDPSNALMWAHYAADNSGLVLEFNPEDDFFNRRRSEADEFNHVRPVTYRPRSPGVTLEELAEQPDVLVSKLPAWAYEQEQRILAPLDDADEVLDVPTGPVHLFRLPPTAIIGVILGPRATDSLVAQVAALLRSDPALAHIGVSRATLDHSTGTITVPAYPQQTRDGV